MAQLTPLTPKTAQPRVLPSDALMMGVHSGLRVASKHKKMVSGVLHLKHESVGKKMRTAFNGSAKAHIKTARSPVTLGVS